LLIKFIAKETSENAKGLQFMQPFREVQ